jgi:pimeloyl-ACP methyl ester carboxylesterase
VDTVLSKDGTRIAFDRVGKGPAVILVDGALCYRASGPAGPLAALLAGRFTVYTYDRRGRGDSGDTGPYAVGREVEDLQALIDAAGGSAYVYGISSGAALALEAASRLGGIRKLALYEAPFIVDDTRDPLPGDFLARLNDLVARDRRGDAVRLFMKFVGVPGFVIAIMRFMPPWSKLTAVAHTLPYDITIVKDYQTGRPLPSGRWSSVAAPVLVMDGGKSPAWMRNATRALAAAIPGAEYRTLAGQTHMLKPDVLLPELLEFFSAT